MDRYIDVLVNKLNLWYNSEKSKRERSWGNEKNCRGRVVEGRVSAYCHVDQKDKRK